MKNDAGWIDLGQKYDPKEVEAEVAGPKVNFPTMFITHKMDDSGNALDDLPDGEFEFTAKGNIISYKEDNKARTCQCEIEVTAIKPSTTKAKATKSADQGLDEALTQAEQDKADEAEMMDNADEDTAEGE